MTVPGWWCPLLLPGQPEVCAWAPRTLESSQIQAGVVVSTARERCALFQATQVCVAAMKLEAYGSARAMLYAKRGGRPAKKAPKPKHANAGVPGLTACVVIRVVSVCPRDPGAAEVAANVGRIVNLYILFMTVPTIHAKETCGNAAKKIGKC